MSVNEKKVLALHWQVIIGLFLGAGYAWLSIKFGWNKLGRIGAKTIGIYLATTMFAVLVGLTLVNIFQPGAKASDELKVKNRVSYELWRDAGGVEKLDELNYAEQNPELVSEIQSTHKNHNDWVSDKLNKAENTKNSGPLQPLVDVVPKNIFTALNDMKMLQIIFFAI